MKNDKKLIQSYVFYKDICFFVSTIDRASSSAIHFGRIYSETMVWEWDVDKNERGAFVGQDEDIEGSIAVHQRMVKELFETGELEL